MRFALAATTIGAIAAIPFAFIVGGARMSGEEFLTSVRCVAYADAAGADLARAKTELNWETHRQADAVVAEARAASRQAAAAAREGAGQPGECGPEFVAATANGETNG